MVLSLFSGILYSAADEITVELDGTEIIFDVPPQIIDGRTMVPLRKIFEEIGALVKWDDETKTVTARKSSKTVTLQIGSFKLSVDKGKTDDDGNPLTETFTLDVPAQIVSGRTLVPARAIFESFGLNVNWDEDSRTMLITSDEEDESWKENTGTVNLSDLTYTGNGIEIKDNQISITKGGDFELTGTLQDGNITVSANEKVKLRLSGASITSFSGPCIFIESADKAYITVTEETENVLTAENSEDGAIYSKDNLEIKGKGTLDISSADGHGIKASDNLTIENGNINILAFGDGIHVNDTFKMTGGNLSVSAIGDGIDSESIVIISGGELNIETNGVPMATALTKENSENTDNTANNRRGGMIGQTSEVEFEKSSKGINAQWMMSISGGDIIVNSASHAIHCQDEIEIKGGSLTLNSEYEKGISAHGNLTVSNSDTLINVIKSTEGLESKNILTINDGTIKIVASDDGINATGGKSGEMMGGGFQTGTKLKDGTNMGKNNPSDINAPQTGRGNRGDMPNMTPPAADGNMAGGNRDNMGIGNTSDCLIIEGGNIEVSAKDDCLDSNGNLVIKGGTIKAIKENGSFTGNNSVLDPDGKLSISAGVTLVLAGGSGTQGNMNISQNTVTIYGEKTHKAGESIILKDENGNTVTEYTPDGSYSAVLITSPYIETGKTYKVSLGTEIKEITISSQNTVLGTQNGGTSGRTKGM